MKDNNVIFKMLNNFNTAKYVVGSLITEEFSSYLDATMKDMDNRDAIYDEIDRMVIDTMRKLNRIEDIDLSPGGLKTQLISNVISILKEHGYDTFGLRYVAEINNKLDEHFELILGDHKKMEFLTEEEEHVR